MNGEPNVEQWWSSLLRYVEDGEVIPIVGRDLLWVDVDGQPTYVPRLLAEELADRLGVPLPGEFSDDPIDKVVRAYFSTSDHDHQLPYAELNSLVRALEVVEPPAALATLAGMPFSKIVSTTCDSFLARAVQASLSPGDTLSVVVNSLGSPMDVPVARTGGRAVVHLLGRANPSPDYAITEADVIEFVHEFLSNNQPERLLKALKSQHVLVIGGVSGWLTRFLLRLLRGGRLWANKGQRHFFAHREITQSYFEGHSGVSRASSRHCGDKGRLQRVTQIRDAVLPRLLVRPRGPLRSGDRFTRTGPRIPMVGRRSALAGHAAASIDGHIAQAAVRLASTRIRRAASAPTFRSAGTACPVPKYISSGVCPRNAEWGSTRLCSWT